MTNYYDVHTHNIDMSYIVDGIDMTSVLLATLRNGSAAGFLAQETSAALLHRQLVHQPTKGHDFVSVRTGRRVECKAFGKYGVDLAPSDMKGKDRRFDEQRFIENSRDMDFIIADVTNIASSFSYVVVPGEHVVHTIGRKVSPRHRDVLFDSDVASRPVNW